MICVVGVGILIVIILKVRSFIRLLIPKKEKE